MRILMLSYEFPPLGGGGSKVVDGLTARLSELGDDIDLVTTHFEGLPYYEKRGRLRIWRVRSWRKRLDRSNVFELASYVLLGSVKALSLIMQNRYDICHTHFIFPDGVIAGLLRVFAGQNFVVTAHGSDVPGYNPQRFLLAHRILKPLWQRVSASADCIVCPSSFLQTLVTSQAEDCDTRVIPNGIDPDRFVSTQKKERVILCVTRLFERKGVQYLIEAVKDTALPYEVKIVGDGPYRRKLEELAHGSRTPIEFLGWIDNDSPELRNLYASAEIFVLASEAENFPISLLEAMSARMAVVACSGTGSADVLGDTGLLVQPKDTASLQHAISRLCADEKLAADLGKRARQRLVEKFSWDSVTEQYRSLYEAYVPRLIEPSSTAINDTTKAPETRRRSKLAVEQAETLESAKTG